MSSIKAHIKALRNEFTSGVLDESHVSKSPLTQFHNWMEQAVEANVDPDTGKITLKNCVTAHDCGQVINPIGVEGQLEGAMAMAAGYGFTEDLPMEDGKIMNPNLVDYKLLRTTEMPETKVIEVETYEPEGPFGSKEAGEGLTNPTAGALGNAIYHATGLSIKELPFTPEKILHALRETRKKK